MIRVICAKLALPLLLVGAVGCQQPAPKKPAAPAPLEPRPAVATPSVSAPTPAAPTTAPVTTEPHAAVVPPAATTPSPPASTLPPGAATTAPVIIGEKGMPVTASPQALDQNLSDAEQVIDTSQVHQLPAPTQTLRDYTKESGLPASTTGK